MVARKFEPQQFGPKSNLIPHKMEDFLLGYREVIPDQTNPQGWKDITLNTGKKTIRIC